MTITVVKEHGTVRLLEVPDDLPEGRPVVFVAVPTPGDSLTAFLRGDENESADDLFPVA